MISFLTVILIGTLLLMLPIATKAGETTTLNGALFTSMSAACVTGLVVYDTYSHWTIFGQIVILTEIQIGGLGFITIGIFAMIMLRRKIGLGGRELIHDSLNTLGIKGSVRLVRRIVFGTLLFEGVGAIILACRFIPEMGVKSGIYYGIFHSISAFCNAGFDLMGYKEPYSSFMSYVSDPIVNITVMALIIVGGIGFIVWEDVLIHKHHIRKYRFQSKIVLATTAILLVGGTILFLIAESDNLFSEMTIGESILAAAFCAVTPRTAGFNTVDVAAFTGGGALLTICLMFIGGSPGSTAGGVKTATIAVIFLQIKSYLLGRRDSTAFGRRFDEGAIKRAGIVVFVNLTMAICGCLLLLLGQGLPFLDVLFEVFSAIGTVGMSTGLTRELNTFSQLVIILLMYCGRVGSLSFAMSFTERRGRAEKLRYPEENITVG
ncbi:MAG: TrkH family potassium uptake protein [Firmicutes bacterium]|nr:TrkH family potassium uptake protein [Bacillota bacterium]